MFLLQFSVENHGSFRDEASLSFVRRSLRTNVPDDEGWEPHVSTVAAIYGANASGKSLLLGALAYFQSLVRHSATSWANDKKMRRMPFRLDSQGSAKPTSLILDFVHHNARFQYGFVVSNSGVDEEWLYSYPTGRRRVLFERTSGDVTFGRSLKGGETALRATLGPRELVLSKGALLKYEQLVDIYHQLTAHIEFAEFGEMSRQQRLRNIAQDLTEGTLDMDDLRLMLRVADVGITGAEVSEEEADPEYAKILRAIYRATHEEEMDDEEVARAISEMSKRLIFEHQGHDGKNYPLSSSDQSTGTLTWLSLAAPAIETLRYGGVFVVDELDASLHPQLAEVLIQMFKDERTNPRHAQLVFTTHDTYFISRASSVRLRGEEVHFVEKDRDGVSRITSLDDFRVRDSDNYARRYLQGRYGALPSVAPAFLSALMDHDRIKSDRHEETV